MPGIRNLEMKILLFLFLNIYAILLLGICAVCVFVPNDAFIFILKIVIGLFCFAGTVEIVISWSRKKRMIGVLLKRNRDGFNEKSFAPYMETPCSQLVVLYVLFKNKQIKQFPALLKHSCSVATASEKAEESGEPSTTASSG
jgi:hypothetical protein